MIKHHLLGTTLAATIALSLLSGCGNTAPADTETLTDAGGTEISAADTSFPVKTHTDLNEVLYEGDYLKVTATGIGPVQFYAVLNLDIENTSQIPLNVYATRSSLNGWTWDAKLVSLDDGIYSEDYEFTLQPGETKSCGLGFSNEMNLVPCNIEKFATIGFAIEGCETENGDPVTNTGYLEVTLPDAEGYTQTYDDSGEELFNEGGIRIVSRGIEDDGMGGYGTKLYIENLSADDIFVTPASVNVDGTDLTEDDLYTFAEVPAGERLIASPFYGVPVNQDSTIKISFTIQKLNLNSAFQGVDSYKDLPLIATTPVVEIKGAK
jgi:hypothetical protein